MRIVMLGCGGSAGLPRLGGVDGHGDWGACDPKNPRNRRRRASILVEADGTRLLVDTGPDLREQLLSAGISTLTAVFYTHAHADHTHGIDDLRPIFHHLQHPVDLYMEKAVCTTLEERFPYIFEGCNGYPAMARAHEIAPGKRLQLGALSVVPFPQQHGSQLSLGYRFEADGKAVAYSTDMNGLPAESWPHVAALDLWIVDALQRQPHPSHNHLAQTLRWIEKVQPKEAWLTHMDKGMDYAELVQELPDGVSPGYDERIWTG